MTRDFFPDLPRLEMHSALQEAIAERDIERARQLQFMLDRNQDAAELGMDF